MTFEVFNAISV